MVIVPGVQRRSVGLVAAPGLSGVHPSSMADRPAALRARLGSARGGLVEAEQLGPLGPQPILVTDAFDSRVRHAMSGSASRAHATAALIGETWLTTTRSPRPGGPRALVGEELLHGLGDRCPSETRLSPPSGANVASAGPPRPELGQGSSLEGPASSSP